LFELRNDRDVSECILSLKVFSPLDGLIAEHYLRKHLKDSRVLSRAVAVVRELVTNIGKYAEQGSIEVFQKPGFLEVVAWSQGRKEAQAGLGLGLEIVRKNAREVTFEERKETQSFTVTARIPFSPPVWSIGTFVRPHVREDVGGDVCLWREEGERLRVLVADVLGHGERAFEVAQKIRSFFGEDTSEDLLASYERLRELLQMTRGCALFLGLLERKYMRCFLVGNVRAWLNRGDGFKFLPARPGVVGRLELPPKLWEESLLPGSRLIVCTDGVERRFHPHFFPWTIGLSPERVARKIGEHFSRREDDVCVLVVEGPGDV